jgi:hypothetical protein
MCIHEDSTKLEAILKLSQDYLTTDLDNNKIINTIQKESFKTLSNTESLMKSLKTKDFKIEDIVIDFPDIIQKLKDYEFIIRTIQPTYTQHKKTIEAGLRDLNAIKWELEDILGFKLGFDSLFNAFQKEFQMAVNSISWGKFENALSLLDEFIAYNDRVLGALIKATDGDKVLLGQKANCKAQVDKLVKYMNAKRSAALKMIDQKDEALEEDSEDDANEREYQNALEKLWHINYELGSVKKLKESFESNSFITPRSMKNNLASILYDLNWYSGSFSDFIHYICNQDEVYTLTKLYNLHGLNDIKNFDKFMAQIQRCVELKIESNLTKNEMSRFNKETNKQHHVLSKDLEVFKLITLIYDSIAEAENPHTTYNLSKRLENKVKYLKKFKSYLHFFNNEVATGKFRIHFRVIDESKKENYKKILTTIFESKMLKKKKRKTNAILNPNAVEMIELVMDYVAKIRDFVKGFNDNQKTSKEFYEYLNTNYESVGNYFEKLRECEKTIMNYKVEGTYELLDYFKSIWAVEQRLNFNNNEIGYIARMGSFESLSIEDEFVSEATSVKAFIDNKLNQRFYEMKVNIYSGLEKVFDNEFVKMKIHIADTFDRLNLMVNKEDFGPINSIFSTFKAPEKLVEELQKATNVDEELKEPMKDIEELIGIKNPKKSEYEKDITEYINRQVADKVKLEKEVRKLEEAIGKDITGLGIVLQIKKNLLKLSELRQETINAVYFSNIIEIIKKESERAVFAELLVASLEKMLINLKNSKIKILTNKAFNKKVSKFSQEKVNEIKILSDIKEELVNKPNEEIRYKFTESCEYLIKKFAIIKALKNSELSYTSDKLEYRELSFSNIGVTTLAYYRDNNLLRYSLITTSNSEYKTDFFPTYSNFPVIMMEILRHHILTANYNLVYEKSLADFKLFLKDFREIKKAIPFYTDNPRIEYLSQFAQLKSLSQEDNLEGIKKAKPIIELERLILLEEQIKSVENIIPVLKVQNIGDKDCEYLSSALRMEDETNTEGVINLFHICIQENHINLTNIVDDKKFLAEFPNIEIPFLGSNEVLGVNVKTCFSKFELSVEAKTKQIILKCQNGDIDQVYNLSNYNGIGLLQLLKYYLNFLKYHLLNKDKGIIETQNQLSQFKNIILKAKLRLFSVPELQEKVNLINHDTKIKALSLSQIYEIEITVDKILEEVINMTPEVEPLRPCSHIKDLTDEVNFKLKNRTMIFVLILSMIRIKLYLQNV